MKMTMYITLYRHVDVGLQHWHTQRLYNTQTLTRELVF